MYKKKKKPSGAYWRNIKKFYECGVVIDHSNKRISAPEHLITDKVRKLANRYKLIIQITIV